MRHFALVLAVTFGGLTACSGDDTPRDVGPAPGPDHQQLVREQMDRVLGKKYELAEPSSYRFDDEPVRTRVPRWHFDGTDRRVALAPGESIYVHGWGVQLRVRPKYAGYPEQPVKHCMALFVDGGLRGLFTEGPGNAPLELDKWHASWIDDHWWEARARSGPQARPRPAGR